MKAGVNSQNSGLEVLSVRRTRKEEVLLILKKGSDIPAFQKALDRVVGAGAKLEALVSRRPFLIRDLDETVEKEEVVAALAGALGRPALDGQCRLYTRFGGVRSAVVRLADSDASRLLQLGKVRFGWVNCRIREHAEVVRCFRCHGFRSHGAALTPAGRTSAGGAVTERIGPRSVRPRRSAWLAPIGAKRMMPMFLGAALAQCSGKNFGGWGAGCEVLAYQPWKGEGC